MALAPPGHPAAAAVAWLVGCVALVEGGLKTKPPSGRGASEPRRLQSSLSGFEYVASGYDAFFGNPYQTGGSVDPGFRSPVFKLSLGSETLPDGKTKVPEGITALQCEGSCSLASKVSSITSMDQYYDFLSTSIMFEAGFADIASFSASADFKRVHDGFEDHRNVYTTVVAHCCAYEAFVMTYDPPPADENFLAAVDRAPVDYDQAFYFKVISEFGTHFLTSAELGGMYGEETQFTHDEYNNMKAAQNDWSIEAQASFIVSINAGVASQTELRNKDFFDKYSAKIRKYSEGAMPPSGTDPTTWMAQTMFQPVPTSMRLKPLSELFTTSFVKTNGENVTKLNAQKNNMERALREYCPEKLLKEGKVDSCKKITNDTDAASADEKTCLAKVWGGGGPKGQPFDDKAELYGKVANVQVSHIYYQSDRWLNNIQLELSLGGSQWPLPEHGGKDGNSLNLAFSPGEKITAVGLSYDKYINKLIVWTKDGIDAQSIGGNGGVHYKLVNFKDAVKMATGRLPREAWLVGFYGHSEKYVNSLGFYVAYHCPSSEAPGPAGVPVSAPNQTASGANAAGATNATNATSTTNAAIAARPPA